MRKELMESLVEVAVYVGANDAPEHIKTINDAMDEIRNLEGAVKDRDEMLEQLKGRLIRQRVKVYNGQGDRNEPAQG